DLAPAKSAAPTARQSRGKATTIDRAAVVSETPAIAGPLPPSKTAPADRAAAVNETAAIAQLDAAGSSSDAAGEAGVSGRTRRAGKTGVAAPLDSASQL